jgi:hypothetical protein
MRKQLDPDDLSRRTKREKAVARSFSRCDYTPQASRVLAHIFVGLAEGGVTRRTQVLGLIERIMEGKNK